MSGKKQKKSKDPILSKRSKRNVAKGKEFERETAIALRNIFPNAERHLEFQVSQATGVDLRNTGEFRIQCKSYKSYAPLSKIREVHEEAGTIPLLVTKGQRLRPIAALYFDDFVKILEALYGKRAEKTDEKIDVDDLI